MSEGPIYTKGKSYRARAEKRQRRYRANTLGASHGKYGHLLATEEADAGRNFVHPEAFEAADSRQNAGKGVDTRRTFGNMLSSQAMCFNLFAPLSSRRELAAEALGPFVPGLAEVKSIQIEYTPARDVFNDQSELGGVDCDLLIEGTNTGGAPLVLVVETKFVERTFSQCGFRDAGREEKGKAVCPGDVPVRAERGACLYARNKGYAYWRRSDEHGLLADDALPERGCPFGGTLWQLWVNLALAHEEARRRGAADARLAVCVSAKNDALLRGGETLAAFRSLLKRPESVHLIDLDSLLERLEAIVPRDLRPWASALTSRYQDVEGT